jgi:hypothetical protein
LKLKRDAAKAAWQRYRRGEITAQQLEQEWRRLETPEALEELRKKDQETRGLQKTEAEKKVEEAKRREGEACKAADPALESQAKEAEAKAAELKKKAEADCKAASECDRSLEDMGPEPEEPETTETITTVATGETETKPQPLDTRCAGERAAMNAAQRHFEALLYELRNAERAVRLLEETVRQAALLESRLQRETAELWSRLSWWDYLWRTEDYRRYEEKFEEWRRASQEYLIQFARLQERREATKRLEWRVQDANHAANQAVMELRRCMGSPPIFAPRRGE